MLPEPPDAVLFLKCLNGFVTSAANRVRSLLSEHRHVSMIGDGVNDALRHDRRNRRHRSWLMKDDLRNVAETIHLGRRTLRIIQFNSLSRSNLFLILSVLGHTSLYLATLADTGAMVHVILNTLRLHASPGPSQCFLTADPADPTDPTLTNGHIPKVI